MEGDLAKTRCMFTLKLPVPILNDRKTDLKRTLEGEQQELEKRTDLEDVEERAQSLDLLTWVEFKLGNPETAMEVNDKALLISQEKREVTLANRAHLFFNRGDLSHAREILDEIVGLPRTAVSEATAIAQQAYCFFRFGGPNNLGEAIKLYEQALEKYSGIYLWSLQLGIVYRRASHPNMIREVDDRDEVRTRMTRYQPRAAELYDHVIMNSSNRRIKAIAYSEKAFMSSMQRQDLNRVESMCRMALELVVNEDPFVLTLCGKALLKVNKLWAQELLERATQAGESSHAFHTLGNCWKSIAKDRRLSSGRCFNDQMEHCFKQAVRLGSDNVPAKLSWAKLLQEKGLMEEAFEKFKDVIISVGNGDNLYTLASTYESAALCMIQYCNGQEVMDSPRGRSIMKEAEQMCIKALALEFKMLRVRELRGRTALECLRTMAESRRNPEASFRLSKLLGIIDDPDIDFQELGMIVKAIDKINTGHVISTLKSYHQNGCLEAAYTLLEVSTVWRGADTVGEDIALEVKL